MARVDTNSLAGILSASKATPATPAVDGRAALSKLQSGQTLTDAEKTYLGLPAGPTAPTAPTGPTVTAPTGPTNTGPTNTGPTKSTGPTGPTNTGPTGPKQTYTFTDPKTGKVYVFNSEAELNAFMVTWQQSAKDATSQAAADQAAKLAAENARLNRQSAYDLLLQQFNQYGLGALVTPLKDLIEKNVSPSQFALELTQSKAYQDRFAANASRIAAGLKALSPAEYIGLEDQYQTIMRNYGLPASYYSKDSMGKQAGFEKFLAGDVSAAELEDRIATAQKRVINAAPEVTDALKKFYPDINNADILAYTLDPKNALENIKRKVTAAEIGGAALGFGLGTEVSAAENLAKYGVTGQQAREGYSTISQVLPRGGQLAAIYGESPYTQQTAEQEVFGLAGATDAAKQRKKLVGLEKAAFSGQTGAAQGALGRERAGNL
jgi:hypothetical protein